MILINALPRLQKTRHDVARFDDWQGIFQYHIVYSVNAFAEYIMPRSLFCQDRSHSLCHLSLTMSSAPSFSENVRVSEGVREIETEGLNAFASIGALCKATRFGADDKSPGITARPLRRLRKEFQKRGTGSLFYANDRTLSPPSRSDENPPQKEQTDGAE